MKHLENCLHEINSLDCDNAVINGLPFISRCCSIKLTDNKCRCRYEMQPDELENFNLNNPQFGNITDFKININGTSYDVDKDCCIVKEAPFFPDDSKDYNLELEITSLQRGFLPPDRPDSEDDPRLRPLTGHFRYMSPIDNNRLSLSSDFEFTGVDYTVENKTGHTLDAIQIKIPESEYSVYIVSGAERKFLVIDTLAPVDYRTFSQHFTAILWSIGLIKQYIHLDESFVFHIDSPENGNPIAMRYTSLRKSIKGQYALFTTNPYSVINPLAYKFGFNGKDAIDLWKDTIKPIPREVVNKLCELQCEQPLLTNSITILTEGTHHSLEIQGAAFAVALETITEFIKNKFEAQYEAAVKPKLDSESWAALEAEMHDIVEKSSIDKWQKDRIKGAISNINKPSNNDKLTAPFKVMGIPLNKVESAAIKKRNPLLHGDNRCELNNASIDSTSTLCSLLHQLCCRLLLRLAGFEGYIVDQPMFFDGNLTQADLTRVFKPV